MRETIERYATGADTRSTDLLDKAFHEHFQVIALTADGVMKLDKDSYIKLIKEKKIGGVARKLKIIATDDDGLIGTAKVTLTGDKAVFHDNLTLIKSPTGWQIVANATRVAKVK